MHAHPSSLPVHVSACLAIRALTRLAPSPFPFPFPSPSSSPSPPVTVLPGLVESGVCQAITQLIGSNRNRNRNRNSNSNSDNNSDNNSTHNQKQEQKQEQTPAHDTEAQVSASHCSPCIVCCRHALCVCDAPCFPSLHAVSVCVCVCVCVSLPWSCYLCAAPSSPSCVCPPLPCLSCSSSKRHSS